MLVNGQLLLPLIGNPVGSESWPLHLPYPFNDDYEVATGVMPTSVVWYVQIVVIVFAHVVAVVLAHRHLAGSAPARREARRSEWPWLVAMVGYTMLSLWLLAQPLVEQATQSTQAAGSMSPAGRPRAGRGAGVLGLAGAVALRVGVAGTDGVRSPRGRAALRPAPGGLRARGLVPARRRAAPAGSPCSWRSGLAGARCAVRGAAARAPALAGRGAARRRAAGLGGRWSPPWPSPRRCCCAVRSGRPWSRRRRRPARGELLALPVTTAAFALLHVPLYGWAALPLDLAVGLLLGGLRMVSGGWGAPAVAHTLADLAGWWLR